MNRKLGSSFQYKCCSLIDNLWTGRYHPINSGSWEPFSRWYIHQIILLHTLRIKRRKCDEGYVESRACNCKRGLVQMSHAWDRDCGVKASFTKKRYGLEAWRDVTITHPWQGRNRKDHRIRFLFRQTLWRNEFQHKRRGLDSRFLQRFALERNFYSWQYPGSCLPLIQAGDRHFRCISNAMGDFILYEEGKN